MTTNEEQLRELAKRVQEAAGANLECLALYGSAARHDFYEQYSDVNLLCVVGAATAALLERLNIVMTWWSKTLGHRPLLILTLDELRESADVFAIETMDLQAYHRVLAGHDVISSISVPMNLHRVQVEHELRTLLLRLRQHYLLYWHDEAELQKVLAKSVSSVVTLLRHAAIAVGDADTAAPSRAAVERAGQVLRVDVSPVLAALDLREARRPEISVMDLYNRCMSVLAAVIRQVNAGAPKSEWRRVGTAG